MLKILIADDHPIVREGLKQILADEPDMEIVGEAGNGQGVVDFMWHNECDVVLLDISMPGRGGLDVIKELKQERPKLAILILSMHPEDQFAVRALRAGASGYLTKASASDELVKAVRKVSVGGKYISPSTAEMLADQIDQNGSTLPHERLSDREYQVMLMLASGKTVKEIADELCLSVKTISTYRSRILEKTKVKNNAQLTIYAVKHHLLE